MTSDNASTIPFTDCGLEIGLLKNKLAIRSGDSEAFELTQLGVERKYM